MTDGMPRDIPVIFSSPMVRALLDGRKTMTRRLAWQPRREIKKGVGIYGCPASPWQKVEPGDRLWVRESFTRRGGKIYEWRYSADDEPFPSYFIETDMKMAVGFVGWSRSVARESVPSIHMPRAFSRLTLVVTSTKIERLQDISEADAKAEGWTPHPEVSADPEVHRDAARDWFSDLWTDLHGVESWRSNPEVVALSFKVVRQNIDRIA